MPDFVVFRSKDGVRAIEVQRGKGVPENHKMRKDEYFGVVVDDVATPEIAVWSAALECHVELIRGLVKVLALYLEEINWDRNQPLFPEEIDEIFHLLQSFRGEKLHDHEALGQDFESEWLPESTEQRPDVAPGQLSLI